MFVTITKIEVTSVKKYRQAEVSYTRDGKDETRKILSFVNTKVFATLESLRNFPIDVNVVMVKNDKGYWEWTDIEMAPQGVKEDVKPNVKGKVIGSNYETPEERARRQVYIIRQSSIASAINYFEMLRPLTVSPDVEDVIEVAKAFEAHVMEQ